MLRIAAVLVSVVAIAIVAVVAPRYFGIEPARALVVQRLEAITGREVAIEDDFDFTAALAPTLVAEGVVIANAAWASDEPMVEAERIEIELQLMPLLWEGNVVIDRLALSGAEVLLETGAEERANWRFEAPAPEAVEDERRELSIGTESGPRIGLQSGPLCGRGERRGRGRRGAVGGAANSPARQSCEGVWIRRGS